MMGADPKNGALEVDFPQCPNCGSNRLDSQSIEDVFQYGSGSKAVELRALIPIHKCLDCGFSYTDFEAEDLRHEAICRHLGVMTPAEILALRKGLGLSRAQFAEKIRVGEASLARWETGQLIQNPANDNYMYLLRFQGNMERLANRFKPKAPKNPDCQFRALDSVSVQRHCLRSRGFLRPQRMRTHI